MTDLSESYMLVFYSDGLTWDAVWVGHSCTYRDMGRKAADCLCADSERAGGIEWNEDGGVKEHVCYPPLGQVRVGDLGEGGSLYEYRDYKLPE